MARVGSSADSPSVQAMPKTLCEKAGAVAVPVALFLSSVASYSLSQPLTGTVLAVTLGLNLRERVKPYADKDKNPLAHFVCHTIRIPVLDSRCGCC